MRAQYIAKPKRKRIENALTAQNRLILDIAERTGLRISDIVALTPAHVREARRHRGWAAVQEQKTGKTRKVHFTSAQLLDMEVLGNDRWVFPHRTDKTRHRTRQATYENMKRRAKRLNVDADGYSPHSYRKIYAVTELRRTGDLEAVRRKLNHQNIAVTAMYATSDKYKFKTPVAKIKKGRHRRP